MKALNKNLLNIYYILCTLPELKILCKTRPSWSIRISWRNSGFAVFQDFFSMHAYIYILIKNLTPLFRFPLDTSLSVCTILWPVPRMMAGLSFLGDSPYHGLLPSMCKSHYASGMKIMQLNKCLFFSLSYKTQLLLNWPVLFIISAVLVLFFEYL